MPLCRICRKDVDQAAKFCSNCGINDPITGKTKPKRKVLKWVLWIFVGIVVIGILSPNREKEPAKAALQEFEPSEEGVIAVEPTEKIELPAPEAQVPNEPESEWNAHEFEVVKDEDISAGSRLRRRVTVMAPAALTREDRIATLMKAAIQAWQKHHSQFIAMFLIPFESGPPIARMDYAPDKCGVSGTECTGKVWTDVNASDVIFTPEQQQVYTAWTNNQDKFMEVDPDYGFEVINEDHLKAFLAEQFDTTPDDISKVFMEVSIGSITSQVKMTIPRQFSASWSP